MMIAIIFHPWSLEVFHFKQFSRSRNLQGWIFLMEVISHPEIHWQKVTMVSFLSALSPSRPFCPLVPLFCLQTTSPHFKAINISPPSLILSLHFLLSICSRFLGLHVSPQPPLHTENPAGSDINCIYFLFTFWPLVSPVLLSLPLATTNPWTLHWAFRF